MVEAVVWGVVPAALFAIVAGFRRLPWGYCAVVGIGCGIVFWAVRVATIGTDQAVGSLVDPAVLVFIGAFCGGLNQFGFDRGESVRKRRSAAFLAG